MSTVDVLSHPPLPTMSKGRRRQREPVILAPPSTSTFSQRPSSPVDPTPIIVHGNPIETVRPPPGIFRQSSPRPAIVQDISNIGKEEDDDDDEVIVPRLNSPVKSPSRIPSRIPSRHPSPAKTIPAPVSQQSSRQPSPTRQTIPNDPPKESLQCTPMSSRNVSIESSNNPSRIPSRSESPMKERVLEREPIPAATFSKYIRPRDMIPTTLSSLSNYRYYKPTDIPEKEFWDENEHISQMNSVEQYDVVSHWAEKCRRLYEKTPALKPPKFDLKEHPKMAAHKYHEYHKKCAARAAAVQIGTAVYCVVGLAEFIMVMYGIQVQGLFNTLFSNKEDHIDALIEMGERSLGWINSTVSNPLVKTGFSVLLSVVILVVTNYGAFFAKKFLPDFVTNFFAKNKQDLLLWIQDLIALLLGTKAADPMKTEGMGPMMLGMMQSMFMGGGNTGGNTGGNNGGHSTHMHDE